MENWEDVKEEEECCNMILFAFEEWEKHSCFSNCSIMLRGHFGLMMGELQFWNKNRVQDLKDKCVKRSFSPFGST